MHVDFDVTLVDFDTKSFETPDSTAREGELPLDIANSVIVKASTTPAIYIPIHKTERPNDITQFLNIFNCIFGHPTRYRYRFSTINIKPIPIFQEIPMNTDYGR